MPVISLDPSESPLVQGSPHVFRIVVPVEARARALARAAAARGAKSFALLVSSLSYATRGAEAFRDEVQKLGGKVVVEEKYDKDATSFVDPVKKLAGKPFDALFIPDTAQKLELIAPQLAVANLQVSAPGAAKPARGARAIVLLSTAEAIDPNFLKGSGRYTVGAILAPGFYPDDTDPRMQAFVLRYRAAYGTSPDYLAAYAWDAALVIRAAVDAGARDRGALLQTMGSRTVAGVTGDVAFGGGRGRSDAGLLFTVAPGGGSIKVWKP
jgi:branched-chain amino acid transport system substrate-binding protein